MLSPTSQTSKPRFLGIDPGYDRCGVAVTERNGSQDTLLHSACITTTPATPYPERLYQVAAGIEELINLFHPHYLVLEKLFFATNRKTAGQVNEVRGSILYLAGKHRLPVLEYTPLQIKQTIAGYGQADKKQIMTMVRRLITLDHEPKYDDEFDAIAAALTASAHFQFVQK